MTADVIILRTRTTLDIPVDRVLDGAKESDLREILIVGRTKNNELYIASSLAKRSEILWGIELAKKQLLSDDE